MYGMEKWVIVTQNALKSQSIVAAPSGVLKRGIPALSFYSATAVSIPICPGLRPL